MDALNQQELLAHLEQQLARIEQLEQRLGGEPPARRERSLTRRGMLTAAAAGTVGVVGAVLLGEGTANAATGNFTSASSAAAVNATNTSSGNAVLGTANGSGGSAIYGVQKSTKASAVGVKGSIVSAKPGAGTGVMGIAQSGTGVAGTSKTGVGVTGTTDATASGAAAVQGTVTSTSPGGYSAGVYGRNNGTGGSGIGVYGVQNGDGWGVYGTTPTGVGVYGYSAGGYGVEGGTNTGAYGVYGSAGGGGTGVNGVSTSGDGVKGTSTSGTGVEGASTNGYGTYGHTSTNYGAVGLSDSGNGVYGQVSTVNQSGVVGRTLDASGNWALYGFGNIGATGTKSAVVPATDGGEHMTLYCVESPECWFEDFGTAQLANGSATVEIDGDFAQTIHTSDYHVFVQAEGNCKGLYVEGKTATSFVVKELDGGKSNVAFAFRIVALRRDVVAPRLNRVALPKAAAHQLG